MLEHKAYAFDYARNSHFLAQICSLCQSFPAVIVQTVQKARVTQ